MYLLLTIADGARSRKDGTYQYRRNGHWCLPLCSKILVNAESTPHISVPRNYGSWFVLHQIKYLTNKILVLSTEKQAGVGCTPLEKVTERLATKRRKKGSRCLYFRQPFTCPYILMRKRAQPMVEMTSPPRFCLAVKRSNH